MSWNTAIWTLNNRDEAEEQNPDATLDAIRTIIDHVENHTKTGTENMGDWISIGDWSDDSVTPEQIAEQWDNLSQN
jgi:hypothetical protein